MEARAYLGKGVEVVVDRVLGSRHPRYTDLIYPINYGFVPGTIGGDGEPVDAYLLGWEEPVERASGVVVAVVLRRDDIEFKLVVAPVGEQYGIEAIRAAIAFQERFF